VERYPADAPFAWQEEYGAFTFDGKRLPNVIAYVERQKEHHARQTIIPRLERAEGDANRPILRETRLDYLADDEAWRNEMLALDLAGSL
jgi:hypothetical protein